jgi:hypothetical protein
MSVYVRALDFLIPNFGQVHGRLLVIICFMHVINILHYSAETLALEIRFYLENWLHYMMCAEAI